MAGTMGLGSNIVILKRLAVALFGSGTTLAVVGSSPTKNVGAEPLKSWWMGDGPFYNVLVGSAYWHLPNRDQIEGTSHEPTFYVESLLGSLRHRKPDYESGPKSLPLVRTKVITGEMA